MHHKKRNAVVLCALILVILIALYSSMLNKSETRPQASVYVGVTYSGDSVEEAKQLIDKVKGYTNLFVIQTGIWERQPEKINDVCTYAANADMHFIVYFGNQHAALVSAWLATLTPALQQKCLGVYFGDEMGGKMLDSDVWFMGFDRFVVNVNKYANGSVSAHLRDVGSNTLFQTDGSIVLLENLDDPGSFGPAKKYTTYYPNGTITTEIQPYGKPRVQVENNETLVLSFPEIWSKRPFQTYDEAADRFVQSQNRSFTTWNGTQLNIPFFTSDYALYWYDYKGGYDVVLAQLGWNHTLTQDIALVRGAASAQNKSWGGIITWKYAQPPYLDSGDAIYDQLRTAYEAGAKYLVIFNYAKDMTRPYGTLQNEHFAALERFWNEVAQNPNVAHGGVKAEAVLVLPHNYGWGMRHPDDKIWGLWQPDSKSPQIWSALQENLAQYETRLDIVYEDEAFPVQGRYHKICIWNQTK